MESRIISKMVRAMKLTEKDTVLINFWGTKAELNDLHDFMKVFAAEKITCLSNDFSDENILALVKAYPEGLPKSWFAQFGSITAIVDLMDKPIGMPPEQLEKEKFPVFGKILSDLFGFMSKHEKMIQITMPTEKNALVAGCDYETYKSRIMTALDVDYDELAKSCADKIDEFKGNERRIRTGKDCELILDTTGRVWNIDAGEGAFPCGEIYIAPVEEKTNGTIYFDKLVLDGETTFENVILTITDGRLTGSNCNAFMAFMKGVPENGADIVAELGIGMNPNVVKTNEVSELDEDALGTLHIAFGMNIMFGGKNNCRFHIDFVTTGEIL